MKLQIADIVDICLVSGEVMYKYNDVLVSDIGQDGIATGIILKTSDEVWFTADQVVNLSGQNKKAELRRAEKLAQIRFEKHTSLGWIRANIARMVQHGAPIHSVKKLFELIGFESPGFKHKDMGMINYEFRSLLPVFTTIIEAKDAQELSEKLSENIGREMRNKIMDFYQQLQDV